MTSTFVAAGEQCAGAGFLTLIPLPPTSSIQASGDDGHSAARCEVRLGGGGGGLNFWLPVSLATTVIEGSCHGISILRLAVSRGTEEIGAGGPYNILRARTRLAHPDQLPDRRRRRWPSPSSAPITAANAVYLTLQVIVPPPFGQLLAAVTQALGVRSAAHYPRAGDADPERCNIAYDGGAGDPLPTRDWSDLRRPRRGTLDTDRRAGRRPGAGCARQRRRGWRSMRWPRRLAFQQSSQRPPRPC